MSDLITISQAIQFVSELTTKKVTESNISYLIQYGRIDKFEKDENVYLLVVEEDGKAVSSVHMTIIENLTHNVRPFAIIENVVTHADYRNKGYASALLGKASEIARERRCYKVFLETGSNKESTLNFYKRNGFEIDKKHSCLKRL